LLRSAVRTAMATDWLVKLVGQGRAAGLDAGLDRQVAAALEFQRLSRLPALDSMDPPRARRFAETGMAALELDPEPMAEVVDTVVAGTIPVRMFVPPDAGANWIIYLHGGGGVIGSIRASEPITRYLAVRTRCTVASVGYRLGPEDKHPAAIDDAFAAWQVLVSRVPRGASVAVAGDSFGGFLSAHVERRARQHAVRAPDLQVLIYPLLDLTLRSPSIERHAAGYLLTRSMMHWFRNHYLHDHDDREAGSPWFWTDLAGSAPAIVATAGYDPLVDEGDAWAHRLHEAGATVRHRPYPSLVHGFLSLAGAVRAARLATDELCADIVDLLGE
jgi:acetyl esterase